MSERLAMDSTAATEAGQVSTLGPIAQHWIDGEWTGSDTVSESVNPATGAVLGRWADGGEAEARAAVAAARRAFAESAWSRDSSLRHRALSELADRFDARAEELGALVTKENGKKLAEGMFESTTAGATLRHAAAQALTATGISAEVAPGQWFSTYAEPAASRGHRPLECSGRPAHPVLAPALSAGNTVAVKMPGQTALVANRVVPDHLRGRDAAARRRELYHRVRQLGRPPPGRFARGPRVSYTGSTAVGRMIVAGGAPELKRMSSSWVARRR